MAIYWPTTLHAEETAFSCLPADLPKGDEMALHREPLERVENNAQPTCIEAGCNLQLVQSVLQETHLLIVQVIFLKDGSRLELVGLERFSEIRAYILEHIQ